LPPRLDTLHAALARQRERLGELWSGRHEERPWRIRIALALAL
jgi:hypothetical protein